MKKILTVKSHILAAWLTAYFTLLLNWPFFIKVYGYIFRLEHANLAFVASIPVFVFCFLYPIFLLLTVKGLARIALIPVMIISAMASFASLRYGVMFDGGMVENIVETNPTEAASYLSWPAAMFTLALGIIPAVALGFIRIDYQGWRRGLLAHTVATVASLALFIGISLGFYQDYASVGRNNQHVHKYLVPSGWLYSGTKYLSNALFSRPIPYQTLGEDAKKTLSTRKPTLMVLIVGETARAEEFQYNGYPRETNPFTQEIPVASLGVVASCGTATAVSVPCMFSLLTHDNYNKKVAESQDNVLDIIQRSGFDVTWIDNDSGCKGVCDHVNHLSIDSEESPRYCREGTCEDGIMVGYLDKLMQEGAPRDQLLVFHMIGSHGPTYFQRYPEEHRHFLPDCQRKDIENCSHEALVNTYDNTIRYTDFVLSQLIQHLQQNPTYESGLIYLSDHGESLGEDGIYLHGLPYKLAPHDQIEVPLLAWFSDSFDAEHHVDISCLTTSTPEHKLTQDNLFHSLLGLLQISTRVYDPSLDFSSSCQKESIAASTGADTPQPI